jgi:hypothetical protein
MTRTDERAVLFFLEKGGRNKMKVRYFPSRSYRLVPIQKDQADEKERKLLISELVKMNEGFLEKGAGKKAGQEYRDVPHFSLKLLKKDGKIHTFVNIPKDKEQMIEKKIHLALYEDIGDYRLVEEPFSIPEKNLYAFAIQGSHHLAINLDQQNRMKEIFRLVDTMMLSMTVKEVEDHKAKRKELTKAMLGLDNWKKKAWHYTKAGTRFAAKELVDFLEEQTKEKLEGYMENLQRKFKKEETQPFTQRKLSSEKNRFMIVEILFFLWTNEVKAKKFQESLQKILSEIQGENHLEVISVNPDLQKVAKGRIHYQDIPTLCLYQMELDKFMFLPSASDEAFYSEIPEKTQIPEFALRYETGAVALGRKLTTNETIALPRTTSETDMDDRGVPTIISGKKGSGKTQLLINQVADTFCLNAKSLAEWRKKARSVVVIDVADGEMNREIYELIPKELKHRVVVLNHADTDHPLPINNRDVLQINHTDGFEEEIASTETEILMDSLKDKNPTVAVERYFKTALQASYLVGKGNLIDAMQILESAEYRSEIIQKVQDRNDNVFLPDELRKMNGAFEDTKTLETIDNRISRVKSIQPWIDCLGQAPTKGLDFWKWINGDENGAYLVLIYIPKRINKSFRKFLFAHYLTKLWYMTEAREILNKEDRKEFLVIIDELHQIFGHRAVPTILEQVYKEARKYRARFIFTIHGWSSIKDKETKDIIKDGSGNYIMLKGGNDMFSSLKEEFEPYTIQDFSNLMRLDYTGIFKVDIKKKTHVFQAKLMEPASVRFKKHRHLTLEEFRSLKNEYGRPKDQVRAKMKKGGEIKCQQVQPKEKTLEEELAELV